MSEKFMFKRGATWVLRVIIAGVEKRESLSTGDVKVARQRRDKRIAAIIGERKFGEVKHRWEDAVTGWATHGIGDLSRNTVRRYVDSLTQCKPFLTGVEIGQIDGNIIQNLIEKRRIAGMTPATIRRDLTAISQVLEYAEVKGWREGNPTLSKRRQKGLKEKRDPITLPTEESISAILAECTPRFRALVVAARLTGCRQDELCSLTWGQFQPKKGTLEVIGKGNKRRVIQLSEQATWHIDGIVRRLGSDLIFCTDAGTKWASPASYFVKIRDRVMARQAIREREALARRVSVSTIRNWEDRDPSKLAEWQRDPTELVRSAAPLPADPSAFRPFRFHDLRHLWAVEALKGGMGLYRLSKHLGHTSVMVTERFYLTFLTDEEAEAAKAKSA